MYGWMNKFMNKRTEIAKSVLAATLANPWFMEQVNQVAQQNGLPDGALVAPLCKSAIQYADELIKHLDNSGNV